MLTPRQELLLRRVVEAHMGAGQPVGSKALAEGMPWGPSTIRNELALLEEIGLLAHPHTSAGRVPTDQGYRYFVDLLLPELRDPPPAGGLELSLVRREVDEAMRVTTETLSQVTDLLAIVSAPPIGTATIRHVEVLPLQPQVLMVVVITSTGGVTKRIFTFEHALDRGLVDWAAQYLNERLVGMGLGARMLRSRLADSSLDARECAFLAVLSPAFTELHEALEETLYFDGTARLMAAGHPAEISHLNEIVAMLERRRSVLEILRAALPTRDVYVRIGAENETPALHGFALVAAAYGLPRQSLGTVSVIGPVRMDYATAIRAVRVAARQLSRFVEDVYDEG